MSVADVHLSIAVQGACPVPEMTDPMSIHWRQPHASHFLFDDTHVCMIRRHFEGLPTYSASYPTGVYAGKMWKRQVQYMSGEPASVASDWYLLWYDDPRMADQRAEIQARKILVVD